MPNKPKTLRQRTNPKPRRQHDRRYDKTRADDPAKQARSTARYQKFRKYYLIEYPLCRPCEERGVSTLADQVHHVRGLRLHIEDLCDPEHCMPVCLACHAWEEGKVVEADL